MKISMFGKLIIICLIEGFSRCCSHLFEGMMVVRESRVTKTLVAVEGIFQHEVNASESRRKFMRYFDIL